MSFCAGRARVTPRGPHLVLRNPIYTGWRVIDKRRDTSAAAKYASPNGRQSDRRKLAREPEDVIRVKVIADKLISEDEFQAVERVMDLKQQKHWRTRYREKLIAARIEHSGIPTRFKGNTLENLQVENEEQRILRMGGRSLWIIRQGRSSSNSAAAWLLMGSSAFLSLRTLALHFTYEESGSDLQRIAQSKIVRNNGLFSPRSSRPI